MSTLLAHSSPQRMTEVKEFLKRTKKVREGERARAILKLMEGRSRRDVAEFFDVNVKTLDKWQRKFKVSGVDGLRDRPQRGNNRLLSREQKDEISSKINSNKPEELGLEGKFWNIPKLKQLVKREYGVVYRSPVSYQKLFKYCGFTFHKPVKVNKKRKDGMRRRFEEVLKKRSDGTVEKMVWYW